MKIVAGIQCYNEEDFIRESVLSLYNFCHKIIITEGCWESGIKSGNSERSGDRTIEFIKSLPDPQKKIKLFHYNGKLQVDHRKFTLEKAKQYSPDWYLNGDGDEIFHEKEVDNLLKSLNSEIRSINPTHKLFWNGLEFYEEWKPMGRFFRFSGLDINRIKTSRIFCNQMEYNGAPFPSPFTPDNIYIYHPSYSKTTSRQKFKINHRTIDNKKNFPHYIENDLILRGNQDLKIWLKSLKKHETKDLPKYLQKHKLLKNANFTNLILENSTS